MEETAESTMWHKLWQVGLHYLLPYIKTTDDIDEHDLDEREVTEIDEADKENTTFIPGRHFFWEYLITLMSLD